MELFEDYLDGAGDAYDEMFDGDELRGPYRALAESLGQVSAPEVRARAESLTTSYLEQGVTFDIGGEERAFPLDIMPRVIEQEAWSVIDHGRPAAGQGARAVPRRRLRHRPGLRRRRDPAVGRHHLVALPPRRGRGQDAQRGADPRGRHRPDPRRRRQLPGARGQRAGAVRGVLRDDQPARDLRGAVRGVHRPPDPAGRDLPPPAAQRPAGQRPGGCRRPDRRGADARVSTTAPTSSTRCSRGRWASSSSRAATWSASGAG